MADTNVQTEERVAWIPEGLAQFWWDHWGDLASVAGLIISIVGFWLAVRAARQAKDAAEKAWQAVVRSETIADFSAAITIMEEIKRLHRFPGAWPVWLERYSALRQTLLSIRGANPGLSNKDKAAIQGALQHCANFESEVEGALASHEDLPGPAQMNRILSKQVDKLSEILAILKRDIGS